MKSAFAYTSAHPTAEPQRYGTRGSVSTTPSDDKALPGEPTKRATLRFEWKPSGRVGRTGVDAIGRDNGAGLRQPKGQKRLPQIEFASLDETLSQCCGLRNEGLVPRSHA